MKKKFTKLMAALALLVFMTPSLAGWGQTRTITMGSEYTVINTVLTSVSDGDLVVWGTSNTNLGYIIESNWLKCNTTSSDWIVFEVEEGTNGFYLKNTADSKYVYSSAAKKIAFDETNKTLFTITDKGTGTSAHYNILYGSNVSENTTTNIGYYTLNSTGIRPYASDAYTDAHLYKVIPPHTLNYSATYGTITGVNNSTSATVSTGASLAYGTVVNLTANPDQGYEFVSWSDGGTNTLSNINGRYATFTMGEANVTITATFTQASQDPTITASLASLSDFSCVQNSGNPSESQSFTVSGANLEGNITFALDESSAFELSTDNTTFGSSISPLSPDNGTVAETAIYVRLKASTSSGDKSGSITISSTNATTRTVQLSGTVLAAKTITWHHGEGGTSTSTTNTYVGATLSELPTPSTVNGWTFIGWAASYTSGYPVTVTAPLTVTAGMSDFYAVYRHGNNVIYQLTTSTSDLSAGTRYMMGYYNSGYLLMTTNFGGTTAVSLDANNQYTYTAGTQWTLGGSNNSWIFTNSDGKYLSSQSTNGNSASLKLETNATDYSYWSISYDDASPKHSKIQNNGNVSNNSKYLKISYYSSTFNCYDNAVVYLFKEVTEYSATPSIELCHVTYNANGATGGEVPSDATGYNPGTSVTVRGNTGSLEKTGYDWAGWCLNAEGTGTVYGPTYTTTYTINANTTFYAKWDIQSYTYTLDYTDAHITNASLKIGGTAFSGSEIPFNTEVEVIVTPENDNYGYIISVKDADDNDVDVSADDKFTMPASAVSITVTSKLLLKYVLVTNSDQLVAGKHYVIASGMSGNSVEGMGYQKSSNRDAVDVEFDDDNKIYENDYLWDFVLGGDATNGWTFYDKYTEGEGFLCAPASGNSNTLKLQASVATNDSWDITIASSTSTNPSVASIVAKSGTRKYMRYNSSNSLFACYEKNTNQSDIYLFVKEVDKDYEFYGPTTLASVTIANDETYTVQNGGLLDVTGSITGSTPANFIINDGGQVKSNSAFHGTMKKNITGYGAGNEENKANYYLMGAPVTVFVNALVPGGESNYDKSDVYWFDGNYQGAEWRWAEIPSGQSSTMVGINHQGFLFAYQEDCELSILSSTAQFPKTTEPIDATNLCNNPNTLFGKHNLVGNPYTCNAYLKNGDDYITYYKMNADGDGFILADAGTAIKPLEGAFVIFGENDNTSDAVTFTTTAPAPTDVINPNITADITADNKLVDRAIVRFGNGGMLPKFQLNQNSTKVFIPQGDKDYAVVSAEAQGEMPVNFKASANGTYTLSVNPENVEMNYLHLIDNMTGTDVDLLANPSYSFEAKTSDYASRFRLVFSANSVEEQSAEAFAFFNGSEWTINNQGEATLQVIDMMGRVLSSETLNGNANVNLNQTAGIYMLRLVNGENVRTQKVIVK